MEIIHNGHPNSGALTRDGFINYSSPFFLIRDFRHWEDYGGVPIHTHTYIFKIKGREPLKWVKGSQKSDLFHFGIIKSIGCGVVGSPTLLMN